MSKVVELDSRRPHAVTPMRCTDCGYEFTSVHPDSAKRKFWECPRCHEMAATEVENG